MEIYTKYEQPTGKLYLANMTYDETEFPSSEQGGWMKRIMVAWNLFVGDAISVCKYIHLYQSFATLCIVHYPMRA